LGAALFGAAGCDRGEFRPLAGPNRTLTLAIQGKTLEVELALDDPSRMTGLMFRDSLEEHRGMLFVYRAPEKLRFHMKNTRIPLSIAFLNDDGEILQIEDMAPHDEGNTEARTQCRFALEVNKGWFQKNGIAVGARFEDFAGKFERIGAD
jgi:hypothetical protein